MADFASFKQVDSDRPLIVNLDLIVSISIDNQGNFDKPAEYTTLIEFHTELPAVIRKVSSTEAPTRMRWHFNSKVIGEDSSAIMKMRDDVLDRLLRGERHFVLESIVEQESEDKDRGPSGPMIISY